jgi:cobalt-zinc-cadmium resistance protein CzcA
VRALKQRLIVAVVAAVLFFFGLDAARKLSVDAFPDVTNVQVQIATEAPGRSPEEVERFATVPLEVAMTGLPGLEEMRSLNKPGLSLITLVFSDKTDVYFARQLVMERLLEVGSRLPAGITPVLGPVSTGLGEVYQYTLERADDGDRALSEEELMKRRVAQDWVVRPLLRSIPGVAEINSQGGYAKQYQVLVNPDKLRHFGLSIADVYQAVGRNNANAGGGVLPQYAEQYLIRGVGLVRDLEDLRAIVLKEKDGVPVYVRDVAEVQIGHEVRQGAVIKNGTTESVGGVVMMIAGGNAKEVVSRIKERVDQINAKGMLPDGLKIAAYYDRSELVDAALWTVTKVLLEGVVLVVVVLFLFLGDVRSSLIVVATLVLTPLLTFTAMNKLGISANLMSLGGSGHRHRPDGRWLGGGRRERLPATRAACQQGRKPAAGDPARGGRGGDAGHLRRRHHHPRLPAADDPAGHGRQDVRAARLHHRHRARHFADPVDDADPGDVDLPAQAAGPRRRSRYQADRRHEAALPEDAALGAGQREKDGDPAVGAFALTVAVLPFLGTAFIPK